MNTYLTLKRFSKAALFYLIILSVFYSVTIDAQTKSKLKNTNNQESVPVMSIDSTLVGVWGVDAQGGYEFRADGTFVMMGSITYRYDAAKGVWHYWQPNMPNVKVTAQYKVSADGKSLSINLKKGNSFTSLKRIK